MFTPDLTKHGMEIMARRHIQAGWHLCSAAADLLQDSELLSQCTIRGSKRKPGLHRGM